jgi:hypothetical protein
MTPYQSEPPCSRRGVLLILTAGEGCGGQNG